MQQFPNNPALRKIAQKRELELLDFSADELKQIQDAEDQMNEMASQQTVQPTQQAPASQPSPQMQPQQGEIADLLAELQSVS